MRKKQVLWSFRTALRYDGRSHGEESQEPSNLCPGLCDSGQVTLGFCLPDYKRQQDAISSSPPKMFAAFKYWNLMQIKSFLVAQW